MDNQETTASIDPDHKDEIATATMDASSTAGPTDTPSSTAKSTDAVDSPKQSTSGMRQKKSQGVAATKGKGKHKNQCRKRARSTTELPASDLSASEDEDKLVVTNSKTGKARPDRKDKGEKKVSKTKKNDKKSKVKVDKKAETSDSDGGLGDQGPEDMSDASSEESGHEENPKKMKQKPPAKLPSPDLQQFSALQKQVAEIAAHLSTLGRNDNNSNYSGGNAFMNYPGTMPGYGGVPGIPSILSNPFMPQPYTNAMPFGLTNLPMNSHTINNWSSAPPPAAPLARDPPVIVADGHKKSKGKKKQENDESSDNDDDDDEDDDSGSLPASDSDDEDDKTAKRHSESSRKSGKKLDFKRVDHIWDSTNHQYKLQDTSTQNTDLGYEGYLFHVRRTFDWEGKYRATIIDIKSKALRECLQEVMGDIKGVSLVEDTPRLDPNMLFLYLEDYRSYHNKLKRMQPSGKGRKARKSAQAWIDEKRRHLKVLVKYLDKDYAKTKKSLIPLLKAGQITFDLVWALWKPGTMAYTSTYGATDHARVFKVDMAEKHCSLMRGEFYYVDGKFLEFDGKQFGYADFSEELNSFQGVRKINSLNVFPLKYHKTPKQVRKDLIERGKKFVELGGMKYKSHQGLAFYRKRKAVVRVNINGRVMIDASTHRRNNPNYPVGQVRARDPDILSDDEEDSDDGCGCGGDSDSDDGDNGGSVSPLGSDDEVEEASGDNEGDEMVTKVFKDNNGHIRKVRLPKDRVEPPTREKIHVAVKTKQANGKDKEAGKESKTAGEAETEKEEEEENVVPDLSDEDYLIASPVVLGFAFGEKLWLEFTVSGIKEIVWNEKAYESLVIEPKTKDIVQALVESHRYHAAESIDDVIQNKGKGLVAVLHGPPGTGKTLTAEGISELLKCPLYMVSAGDLGTDSRYLEGELQKVLDICHIWGAILLLDEADVFLEQRTMHDVHRNALVSIFLRQLEYFQGILFLTTNRVETFDEAFQSRIHIALRYGKLELKAKKAIFKIFLERAREHAKITPKDFTDADILELAKRDLNGRQIKNTVATAQALAVNKGEGLEMRHIRVVMDVARDFERDLKGGPGFEDAMKSYF